MKSRDINQLLEGLRKNMLEFSGTEEDKEIKMALYVAIELAKSKSFDERYYLGSDQLAKRIVKQAREDSKSENFERTLNKRKLICISIANTYKRILNNLCIDCEVFRVRNSDHLYNVVTLSNGRKICVDVQEDLYRIHTGRKLNHFCALGENDFLPDDRLIPMLVELGYTKDKDSYNDRDNKIEAVRQKVADLTPDKALDVIFSSDELFQGLENLETSEAYSYYYALRRDTLDRKRFKRTYQFPCARLDDNGEPKDFTFCIYADTYDYRTVNPYLYSKKEGKIIPCDLVTLDKLQDDGLKLGRLGIETRVGKLRRYMKQAVKASKRREEETR